MIDQDQDQDQENQLALCRPSRNRLIIVAAHRNQLTRIVVNQPAPATSTPAHSLTFGVVETRAVGSVP